MFNKIYYPGEALIKNEKGRVYFYDNLRFILIFLVVQRHFLFRVNADYAIISGLYMVFLWFLMPLFVFTTGFYSKSIFTREGEFRIGRIVNFVVLYLFLDQLIYLSTWLSSYILGSKTPIYSNWNPFDMGGAEWYMWSCAVWFLMIPILRKTPAKIAIPASIIIGVVSGYCNWVNSFFALVKILGFLPFFVVGYYLTTKHFDPLLRAKAKWRILSIIFLFIFAIIAVVFRNVFIATTKSMLEVRVPFSMTWQSDSGIGPEIYWLLRLFHYASIFIVSIAFVLIVPMRKTFITSYGGRTLQIYIIHTAIVRLLKPLGYYNFLDTFPPYLRDFMLFLSAAVLCFLLSFKFLGLPFNFLAKKTDGLRL
ncbi:MAG: hypothetical protein LBD41_07705 [Clostridiales Family XIII bacterium]|jgi:fucose 4-O-acetylase-like acetyltransferase|nr:hypothetical protein [Clostridiales Family XIII bacterium]